MLELIKRMDSIAHSDAAVLITGESGTGKELVAHALHEEGERRDKPFVAVNCAAFPDTLIESELFGHERGAFTDATRRRDGRFKSAHGGTLFLDEVAELSQAAQAKLLRVLQEGTIEPLGSNESIKVDVRIISATHRDLKQRIADGLFREDLYYRINTLDLEIPPLRRRPGDLAILAQHFLQRFSKQETPAGITWRAWNALSAYPFPGNVRELMHTIEHATLLAAGEKIDVEHLPGAVRGDQRPRALPACGADGAARRREPGVRARLPRPCPVGVRRQEDQGRRVAGDLPEESVGEDQAARDLRPRRRARTRPSRRGRLIAALRARRAGGTRRTCPIRGRRQRAPDDPQRVGRPAVGLARRQIALRLGAGGARRVLGRQDGEHACAESDSTPAAAAPSPT